MSKIALLPNEAILKQDSRVTHDKTNGKSSWDSELFLTNFALVVIHKGAFGGAKEVLRYPLSQVNRANGVPQAVSGRSASGKRQLHVYFPHGMEAFTLGVSDDDDEFEEEEEGLSLASLFVSSQEKEKRRRNKKKRQEKDNVKAWCAAIAQAVLVGMNYAPPPPTVAQPQGCFGGVAGVNSADSSANMPPPTGAPVMPPATFATMRCMGCMAPVSGTRGQKAVCAYCDTEQVIQ